MTGPFFDFRLPDHLIAQHPTARRDDSRLLVVRRASGTWEHGFFRDLPGLLDPGDLIVWNDSRVLPARLIGRREKTGGKWEGLFLRTTDSGLWEMLAQSRGYPVIGETFITEPGGLPMILRDRTPERRWLMEAGLPGTPASLLGQFGHIPLPPYIRKGRAGDTDRDRYQTVFAQASGSVAAPTAGLHFTPELIQQLAVRGIETARVTLHVGLGTFEPVKAVDPADHIIHGEWCEVPTETVDAIKKCRDGGNRVIAVGTTTTRTLEAAVRSNSLKAYLGETRLYILPGFEFQVIDGLITNFHLPRSTLLLLVGAFAGSDLLRRAYREAIDQNYRFYSYGDAMLIL